MANILENAAAARISQLLDANSFVEIGAGVTARSTDFNLSEKKAPSDGVVTGYGQIDGNLVYVYAQNPSVLNGTVGEMHARKIASLYRLAVKTGAPVVGLIDCAGMRLEEATDSLHAFGQIYQCMTDASGVIPQITAVLGTCGGGMALVPALSDFTFMASDARLFVNTPNALTDQKDACCETDRVAYQAAVSGNADFTGTEAEIFASMRTLISMLPSNNEDDMSYAVCTDDLNRVSTDLEACAEDPALLLPRISDNNVYVEAGAAYAKCVATAFIRLNGVTVGAVANRSASYDAEGNKTEYGSVMCAGGAEKAAAFVRFCDAFSIPVVTFTNVTAFKASAESEKRIARAAAKLTAAFADATCPKVNVITQKAFGSPYLVMNSKAVGADMVFAWSGAKIGMMDAAAAAKIMYHGENGAVITEKTAEYDALQNSVESAAARGYVDTVIPAEETRKYLIGALDMLFTKREFRPDRKHGTV